MLEARGRVLSVAERRQRSLLIQRHSNLLNPIPEDPHEGVLQLQNRISTFLIRYRAEHGYNRYFDCFYL